MPLSKTLIIWLSHILVYCYVPVINRRKRKIKLFSDLESFLNSVGPIFACWNEGKTENREKGIKSSFFNGFFKLYKKEKLQ